MAILLKYEMIYPRFAYFNVIIFETVGGNYQRVKN